jgi:hypothetical protein
MRRTSRPRGSPVACRSAISCSSESLRGARIGPRLRPRRRGTGWATPDKLPAPSQAPLNRPGDLVTFEW